MNPYMMYDEQWFSQGELTNNMVSYHLYTEFGDLDEVYKLKSAVHKKLVEFFDQHYDVNVTLDCYSLSRKKIFFLFRRCQFASVKWIEECRYDESKDPSFDIQSRIARMNNCLPPYIKSKLRKNGIQCDMFASFLDS